MKARTPFLGLIILLTLVFNDSIAQKASRTTNAGLTIGFGGGMAYQKSDLANSRGFGFDFTLGSMLYQKENAFLSVDWKFRFLAGQNKAYDHRINPDNSYSNIRYSFFNYDLELGLTLNRLRERTGIVLSGFAGAGITHGRTFTDLYDAGNNLYNYGSIDPNQDRKVVYNDLVELSDGDFETALVNKASFLPTAGLFLGYQLSRSLTIGIEFKTNFYLTEENSFAGIDLDNRVYDGSGIDRNNYVSLGLGWKLGRGSSSGSVTNNSSYTTNNNRVVAVSSARPSVKITDPSTDPYHTVSTNHTLRATIENVGGPENISFYQNGFPNNGFTYNVNTSAFLANIRLRDGENSFRITATNPTASSEDALMIILESAPEAPIAAPTVEFSSPSGDQFTSSLNRIEVTARVQNISNKEDIQFVLNGKDTPFEFYPYSGLLSSNVQLNKGDNDLLIKGSNESGSALDQLTVYFDGTEKIALPAVRFINPIVSLEVSNRNFPLSAQTQNVSGRNDVSLTFNGTSINNFYFSENGAVSVSLILSEGINQLEIIAQNEAGFASDRTSITYLAPVFYVPVYTDPLNNDPVYNDPVYNDPVNNDPVRRDPVSNDPVRRDPVSNDPVRRDPVDKDPRPCSPPLITLIDPVQEQVSTRQPGYTLKAEVRNTTNNNQLRLMVNGKSVPFSFSNNLVSSSVSLVSGLNTISLHARNECGDDRALTRINYTPAGGTDPCTPPTLSYSVKEVNRQDATHELRGTITGVKNKTGISLTIDGRASNGFQFVPASGDLSAKFKLAPGSHTLVVSASNECGTDSKSESVTVAATVPDEEEACGIRINPGNSAWQFCLVTPSGTYSRENLTNKNFSYSGSASSLYIMPIGGGGEATVNGKPYTLRSGQYYLFSGRLNVSVSTSNPGAMGQWSVCITADRAPVSGNGNNRPKSPCEEEKNGGSGGNRTSR